MDHVFPMLEHLQASFYKVIFYLKLI